MPDSTSDVINDFSIERLGVLRWRVLYRGKSWFNDYTHTLPQTEWCPTRRWALCKARRLARRKVTAGVSGTRGEPVAWTNEETRRKRKELALREREAYIARLEQELGINK